MILYIHKTTQYRLYNILKEELPRVKHEAYGYQHVKDINNDPSEKFEDVVHFIIINLFIHSVIWVWNIVRGIFQGVLLRINLYITIINCMVIMFHHDIWNFRTGIGITGAVFEVHFWWMDVPLSWRFIWLIPTKGIGLIHVSTSTRWERFRTTYYALVGLVSNYSIEFSNSLLSNTNIGNEWLERLCIIFRWRWSNKRVRYLTLWSQVIWGSNNSQIKTDTVNISLCVDILSSIFVK